MPGRPSKTNDVDGLVGIILNKVKLVPGGILKTLSFGHPVGTISNRCPVGQPKRRLLAIQQAPVGDVGKQEPGGSTAADGLRWNWFE